MQITEPRRVLIVDDERPLRRLMAALIDKDGYETLEAQNGADALQIAEGTRIDLLLTDFDMPGMNGLELIGILKDRGLVARSLIVTGHADRVFERMDDLHTSIPLLAKPFTPQQLLLHVHAAFNS